MKILACGSRRYDAPHKIGMRIKQLPKGTLIIHGGGKGADQHIEWYAKTLGYKTAKHTGGRALDLNPALVLAFWDGSSRGTLQTLREARKRGIPTEVVLTPERISATTLG